MKKISKILFLQVLAVFAFFACTDGFDEFNKNPNKTEEVEPEYIFGLAPVSTLRALSDDCNWFFFGNYTNQMSVVGGAGPHFAKDGRGDDQIWGNLYTKALNPVLTIEKTYKDNPAYNNRVAIAKIWKAYVFSQLTAIYGPVPYVDACNEGPYMRFDSEEFIYGEMLRELKEAYTALDPKGDRYPEAADPFIKETETDKYIQRWSQFAHCIRLRIAFRVSEADEFAPELAAKARAIVVEELNNAEEGKLITSNAGNFFMSFGADEANQNPFYKKIDLNPVERDLNDPGNYPVIHESMILWTSPKTYNDPCLTSYMKKGDQLAGTVRNPSPEYYGRPYANGTPQGYRWETGKTNPYDGDIRYLSFSQVGRDFSGMTSDFQFFTYPEIAGYRAEASYKNWWKPGEAEKYYYEVIDARCTRFNARPADVQRYKDFPGIKWSTASDTLTRVDPDDRRELLVDGSAFRDFLGLIDSYLGEEEDNYKRIVLQQWLNFFYQGVDCWTLLKRTQVLEFKPHWTPDISTAFITTGGPRGNYAYVPNRLAYPSGEYSKNAAEVKKAIDNLLLDNTTKDPLDQITFRLIFCKDYPGLMGVPMNESFVDFPNLARNRQQ